MNYLHVEIDKFQMAKDGNLSCGDVFACDRTENYTTIVLCDGIGSGVKANIAATMCLARATELLRSEFTLHKTFSALVRTMHQWRDPGKPFVAFSLARILNDGEVTVLSYDAPPPIVITANGADVLEQSRFAFEPDMLAKESFTSLNPGDSLMLVSDGIVEAGRGDGMDHPWGAEGLCDYVAKCAIKGLYPKEINSAVFNEMRSLCNNRVPDDCSSIIANCREAKLVTILTGPPTNSLDDSGAIKDFMGRNGKKVVCGSTTSEIVARVLEKQVEVDSKNTSNITPPKYLIEGIDLVTEGAVTLNQLYNILDIDPSRFDEINAVTDLYDLLVDADKIDILFGQSSNPANSNISFRQQGIIGRRHIIPMIAEKLREMGKLVTIQYY